MSSADLDLIRSKINLVDLVSKQIVLRKTGGSWKGLCPFHQDKNPSFDVSPTIGRYRCWACGAKGDIFSWVMQTQNVDFKEALIILAKEANVTLASTEYSETKSVRAKFLDIMESSLSFFCQSLSKNSFAKTYCENRFLTSEIIKKWELGYGAEDKTALAFYLKSIGTSLEDARKIFLVDKDSAGGFYDRFTKRLIFPIRNDKGELVAFGGRILDNGHPKYINSSESIIFSKRHVLYGLYHAKKSIAKENKAILVEGYMDVIACHQAGLSNTVASLGTSFSSEHAHILRRWCSEVVILYDGDAAGQLAAEKATEVLKNEGLITTVILLPEGQDPDTLLNNIGPHAILNAVAKGISALGFKIMRLEKTYGLNKDHFWNEVTSLLAKTEDPFERERYILELSGKHPTLNDISAAQRAIRQSIALKNKKENVLAKKKSITGRIFDLYAVEKTIFHGLIHFDPLVREVAWKVCVDQKIFYTQNAQKIAYEIKRRFPTQSPNVKIQEWIYNLDTEVQNILSDLFFEDINWINIDVIKESASKLKLFEDKKELKKITKNQVEDQSLDEIYRKMQKWKN